MSKYIYSNLDLLEKVKFYKVEQENFLILDTFTATSESKAFSAAKFPFASHFIDI